MIKAYRFYRKSAHPYFKIEVAALAIVVVLEEVFTKVSSLLLLLVFVAKANNITINTGTNKSKNGDTLVNFFMVIWFKVFIIFFFFVEQRE